MGNTVITLDRVSKRFRTGLWKHKLAVKDLSFDVAAGDILGLLGPNGSGKSTTLKMIMGFLRPTAGEILIGGRSAHEESARRQIGYLPENPRFPKFLTARELLRFYAELLGLDRTLRHSRADELLEVVQLSPVANERIQGFSKGMTQRLAIAQSLLSKPSILIFDEPMSGLDPLGRLEIRRLITQIHQDMPHVTIFFSTHILSDIESLCSSVLLLRQGQLQRQCGITELLSEESQRYELHLTQVPVPLRDAFLETRTGRSTPGGLTVWMEGNTDSLVAKLVELRQAGVKVVSLSSQRKTLEEALFGSWLPSTQRLDFDYTQTVEK